MLDVLGYGVGVLEGVNVSSLQVVQLEKPLNQSRKGKLVSRRGGDDLQLEGGELFVGVDLSSEVIRHQRGFGSTREGKTGKSKRKWGIGSRRLTCPAGIQYHSSACRACLGSPN